MPKNKESDSLIELTLQITNLGEKIHKLKRSSFTATHALIDEIANLCSNNNEASQKIAILEIVKKIKNKIESFDLQEDDEKILMLYLEAMAVLAEHFPYTQKQVAQAYFEYAIKVKETIKINNSFSFSTYQVYQKILIALNIAKQLTDDSNLHSKIAESIEQLFQQLKKELALEVQGIDPAIITTKINAIRTRFHTGLSIENFSGKQKKFCRELSLYFKEIVFNCFKEMSTDIKYVLVSLGSLSKQTILPYSDLEFVLLLDQNHPDYMQIKTKLAYLLDFLIRSLGETESKGEIPFTIKPGLRIDTAVNLFNLDFSNMTNMISSLKTASTQAARGDISNIQIVMDFYTSTFLDGDHTLFDTFQAQLNEKVYNNLLDIALSHFRFNFSKSFKEVHSTIKTKYYNNLVWLLYGLGMCHQIKAEGLNDLIKQLQKHGVIASKAAQDINSYLNLINFWRAKTQQVNGGQLEYLDSVLPPKSILTFYEKKIKPLIGSLTKAIKKIELQGTSLHLKSFRINEECKFVSKKSGSLSQSMRFLTSPISGRSKPNAEEAVTNNDKNSPSSNRR
ncbi:hypothetical protein [Legionella sp.]|uniref:hypothetical protein n=1 Tax=Legionella sp. TaxID=459 RepID=UPI0032204DED